MILTIVLFLNFFLSLIVQVVFKITIVTMQGTNKLFKSKSRHFYLFHIFLWKGYNKMSQKYKTRSWPVLLLDVKTQLDSIIKLYLNLPLPLWTNIFFFHSELIIFYQNDTAYPYTPQIILSSVEESP